VLPAPVDFSQWHRYGLLWIPATPQAKGSLTYFFDGRQIGPPIVWTQFQGQAPVSPIKAVGPATPWAFGVIDRQHLVLILGSGASTPLRVKQVVVWQASAAADLRN